MLWMRLASMVLRTRLADASNGPAFLYEKAQLQNHMPLHALLWPKKKSTLFSVDASGQHSNAADESELQGGKLIFQERKSS